MSQEITSALMTDESGQQIVGKLESIRALIGAKVTPATTAVAGIVKPDGQTISVTSDGTISVPQPSQTTFGTNTVTETYSDGNVVTTFNQNGSITETYPNGDVYLTTFNQDGSITRTKQSS